MAYKIKRSLKINGSSLSVFFQDNESPPLFSLQDSLKIIFKDYSRDTHKYSQIIPPEHKQKIALGYTFLWTIDLEGFCILARDVLEEPEMIDILKEINRFVNREKGTLPSPVKTIEYQKQEKHFKQISFKEQKLCYFMKDNNIEYRAKDLGQVYGVSAVENAIKDLDERDIRYYDTEKGKDAWLTDDGLMDLFCAIEDISTPLEDYEEIHELIAEEERISGVWNNDYSIPTVLIDGDKTDHSRYKRFMTGDISCVAYNTGERVITYYDIEDICRVQSMNKEEGKRAAIHHNSLIFFAKENKVFVTLFGVNEVMKHLRKSNHKFIVDLVRKSSEITDKMTWGNLTGETAHVLRHELEVRENDTMTPVKVQGLDLVVLKAAELEIAEHGKRCWILQAKTSDLQSDTMPLFVMKSLEDILGFTRARNKAADIPPTEICKVTIPGFRKHNAYTVTRAGLRTLGKIIRADPSVIKKIEDVADAWIAETAEDIRFAVQLELTKDIEQAKAVVEVTEENKEKEEIKEASEFEFEYKGVKIKGAVQPLDNVIMVYYDKESLSQVTTVEDTPVSFLNGRDYIAINHMADAIGKPLFSDIFKASRQEYEKVVERLLRKNNEPQDMMYNYLGSQNTEVFILGAVMLAERLRNLIVWLRVNQKKRRVFAGPSSNDLLNNLWKHIDCQDHKEKISFGFRKLVTAVTARYETLRDMIRFQQQRG